MGSNIAIHRNCSIHRQTSSQVDKVARNLHHFTRLSGRSAPAALKDLGDHPDGGKITVRDGRYGPYVNWEKVNATLPKGKDPQSVTVEEAMALIKERAAKAPATKAKAPVKKKAAAAGDAGETKSAAKPKAASKAKAANKPKATAKTKKA